MYRYIALLALIAIGFAVWFGRAVVVDDSEPTLELRPPVTKPLTETPVERAVVQDQGVPTIEATAEAQIEDRAPSDSKPSDKQGALYAKEHYSRLRANSRQVFHADLTEHLVAQSKRDTLIAIIPAQPPVSVIDPAVLSTSRFRTYAPKPATNEEIFADRGGVVMNGRLPGGAENAPLIPLRSFANADGANLASTQAGGLFRCDGRGLRRWKGAARISNRSFAETFVVCETGGRFGIEVNWRTSDVCTRDEGFQLNDSIRRVVLAFDDAITDSLHKHIGKRDTLAIDLVNGSRLLLECSTSGWELTQAGKTEWG